MSWQSFSVARQRKPAKPYHHGDLRETLLAAAIELIAERGLHALSLRECARRADVSHAAPYRHFADKGALVLALARRGFGQLAAAGVAAMAEFQEPRDRLDAYGAAYVRFAVENPVLFRVMFTVEFDGDLKAEAARADDDGGAFDLLVEATAAVVDGTPDQALLGTIAAWSLPHGLAMLILDGRIPAEQAATPDDAEALARATFAQWRGPLG